jgi:hypothetical protein
MNSVTKTSRILGIAFLLQFFTSFISNVFILPQATGLSAMSVPGNFAENLVHIADNIWLLRLSILLDMFTALGVIFLGAMLFVTLRKENEKIALTALGFYILEGALLAASKLDTFLLLRLSQEYAAAAQPANLLLMAQMSYETMLFIGGTLHTLAFCLGATLFYYLLDQSRLVPRALSLWGLITVLPILFGTVLAILGYEIPFIFYVPYVPFELVIGLWILVKGTTDTDSQPVSQFDF